MKSRKDFLVMLVIVLMFAVTCASVSDGINERIVNAEIERVFRGFSMTEAVIISQRGIDLEGYYPDGKISIVKDKETGNYIAFWGEFDNHRTIADTTYLEYHISRVRQSNRVYGRSFDRQAGFNDGGSWFIGVHRLQDGRLAGFFHAESHWPVGDGAYKSIGVTYSSDNGLTWESGKKILNANYKKAATAEWGALGDGCVVYNEERNQFIAYYSGDTGNKSFKICMAVSSDPAGAPETWYKWDGTDFTIEGYNNNTGVGGRDIAIEGLQHIAGANPSVMWNTYLQKWIMVYHGWNRVIYFSTSYDGLVWDTPMPITDANERAWYPNLISESSDTIGGQIVRLYYARFHSNLSTRDMAVRTITFE